MVDGLSLTVEELEARIKELDAQVKTYSSLDFEAKREIWREQDKLREQLRTLKIVSASEIEKLFFETYKTASVKINEQLAIAHKALKEACDLAEEFGIPFSSSVVFNGDNYFPASMAKKWDGINEELLGEFLEGEEIWPGEYGGGYLGGYGWNTSYC